MTVKEQIEHAGSEAFGNAARVQQTARSVQCGRQHEPSQRGLFEGNTPSRRNEEMNSGKHSADSKSGENGRTDRSVFGGAELRESRHEDGHGSEDDDNDRVGDLRRCITVETVVDQR